MEQIGNWLESNQSTIISIAIILLVAFILKKSLNAFIDKSIRKMVKPDKHTSKVEEKQREDTLIKISSGILSFFYWPIISIIVISKLGVNIAPLLAGAGVIGLAVGFGAQSLVKDIVTGLFIIAENQYRVGDVVKLDGQSSPTIGTVESVSLRVTVLRDLDGLEHHVPNGTIELTSNYSKEYSGINLNVGVSYEEDLEKVIRVVNQVGDKLSKENDWQDQILKKPQFLRVDEFGDSSIVIKITGVVKPLKQWAVTGELRKRIKLAFDENDIEIPFPQRVIHQKG